MRTLLQTQGIVFVLFGILLALVGGSLGSLYGRGLALIFDSLAVIAGILGVALSLSKDRSDQ